jgi:para-nitrobenzyl esterase
MSGSAIANRSTFTRRKMLSLSAATGAASVLPGAAEPAQGGRKVAPGHGQGLCSTPRTAVATTRHGKVRGYVDDGVLTFNNGPMAGKARTC